MGARDVRAYVLIASEMAHKLERGAEHNIRDFARQYSVTMYFLQGLVNKQDRTLCISGSVKCIQTCIHGLMNHVEQLYTPKYIPDLRSYEYKRDKGVAYLPSFFAEYLLKNGSKSLSLVEKDSKARIYIAREEEMSFGSPYQRVDISGSESQVASAARALDERLAKYKAEYRHEKFYALKVVILDVDQANVKTDRMEKLYDEFPVRVTYTDAAPLPRKKMMVIYGHFRDVIAAHEEVMYAIRDGKEQYFLAKEKKRAENYKRDDHNNEKRTSKSQHRIVTREDVPLEAKKDQKPSTEPSEKSVEDPKRVLLPTPTRAPSTVYAPPDPPSPSALKQPEVDIAVKATWTQDVDRLLNKIDFKEPANSISNQPKKQEKLVLKEAHMVLKKDEIALKPTEAVSKAAEVGPKEAAQPRPSLDTKPVETKSKIVQLNRAPTPHRSTIVHLGDIAKSSVVDFNTDNGTLKRKNSEISNSLAKKQRTIADLAAVASTPRPATSRKVIVFPNSKSRSPSTHSKREASFDLPPTPNSVDTAAMIHPTPSASPASALPSPMPSPTHASKPPSTVHAPRASENPPAPATKPPAPATKPPAPATKPPAQANEPPAPATKPPAQAHEPAVALPPKAGAVKSSIKTQVEMKVSIDVFDKIMGRGGKGLRKLSQVSEASVRFETDPDDEDGMKIVMIGDLNSVLRVQQEINVMVQT